MIDARKKKDLPQEEMCYQGTYPYTSWGNCTAQKSTPSQVIIISKAQFAWSDFDRKQQEEEWSSLLTIILHPSMIS